MNVTCLGNLIRKVEINERFSASSYCVHVLYYHSNAYLLLTTHKEPSIIHWILRDLHNFQTIPICCVDYLYKASTINSINQTVCGADFRLLLVIYISGK